MGPTLNAVHSELSPFLLFLEFPPPRKRRGRISRADTMSVAEMCRKVFPPPIGPAPVGTTRYKRQNSIALPHPLGLRVTTPPIPFFHTISIVSPKNAVSFQVLFS